MALTLLIIDRNPLMRARCRRTVECSPLDIDEVMEADSADQGMQILDGQWVDAVILDGMLPGGQSKELIKRIRKHEVLGEMPLLVTTADGRAARRNTLVAAGADYSLVRPFQPWQLIAKLKLSMQEDVQE